MEEWKAIINYEGLYEVSSLGNVRATKRQGTKGNNMSLQIDKDGYLFVRLSKDCKIKRFQVHRLVGLAFIENIDNKPEINHKDRIRSNNIPSNLEWCTRLENNQCKTKTYRKRINY